MESRKRGEKKERKQWRRELDHLGVDTHAFAMWACKLLSALNDMEFDAALGENSRPCTGQGDEGDHDPEG